MGMAYVTDAQAWSTDGLRKTTPSRGAAGNDDDAN